jgi:hypothetical protein
MTFFGYSVQLLSQRFESTIVDCERIDKKSEKAGGTVNAGRVLQRSIFENYFRTHGLPF